MIFDDVYTTQCIFGFVKFVYHANDASKCLMFLFKKWHKVLSTWQGYSFPKFTSLLSQIDKLVFG